ncbi:Glycosyl transferase family 2 [Marivirga sericea]|uniref:Glycosyl transferase family 2 n=1 Tax=Marivirga sericea TaxID=1028 RepID=A0A1X7IK46_9BACT|nr:glycosyltransferase [Marivirga sericea]SMG15320.1 Glycosyl transferase family 2 [Marivirga sericea]
MSSRIYFERYAYPERFIKEPIKKGTFITVVIPSFKEDDISPTLNSLITCKPTLNPVEVIWVINHPDNASASIKKQSIKTVAEIEQYVTDNPSSLKIHIVKAFDLPSKKAGVGLARKIGMDEAAFRLNSIDQDGIILCFDADSTCQSNYLQEIEQHFLNYPNATAASIHYEHPLKIQNGNLNSAIILYELHLRYYIQALKYAGYPFAYHTIGSSMAVRSSIYQKQGGMNQRKAGEDFYFLHKIIPLGDFHNITTTKVIPSPRLSDRVPFGTGRAMQEHQNQKKDLHLSYNFEIFKLVKSFLSDISKASLLNNLPLEIRAFLRDSDLQMELDKVIAQASNDQHLKKRFFEWFNGFKMLKLVHFLRDNYYPEQKLVEQSAKLLSAVNLLDKPQLNAIEALRIFRDLDGERF